MIYHHYYDFLGGRTLEINQPRTTTNIPMWTSTSGLRTIKRPQIDVVKSEKFTTLVIRDDNENIVIIVDLSAEEGTELAEKLSSDNNS